jgi:DNA-binding response OmpR family regulator
MAAYAGAGAPGVSLGVLTVDPIAGTASLAGEMLDLSRRQLELLALLVSNHNRVVSRAELSDALGLQQARSVDVLLSRIRRTLGFGFIRTVPKRGWIVMPLALERNAPAGSGRRPADARLGAED